MTHFSHENKQQMRSLVMYAWKMEGQVNIGLLGPLETERVNCQGAYAVRLAIFTVISLLPRLLAHAGKLSAEEMER